jgi:hypothetical protein
MNPTTDSERLAKIAHLIGPEGNLIESDVYAPDFLDAARPTGFLEWLRDQAERDDAVGDLARDAGSDQHAQSDAQLVRRVQTAGCGGARRALAWALRQYQAHAELSAIFA